MSAQKLTGNCREDCLLDQKISALFRLSKIENSETDIKELTQEILGLMENNLGMKQGMITLFNREKNEIFVEKSFGYTPEQIAKVRYSPGEGVTGKAIEAGKAIVIPKVGNDPRFLDRTGAHRTDGPQEKSFLCVPIKFDKETIGTLSASRPYEEDYNLEKEAQLLAIVSSMISHHLAYHRLQHEQEIILEENNRLREELKLQKNPKNIIGNSGSMQEVFRLLSRISPTETTVLILGESGVGKERVADAIHYSSKRASGPLIKFNCAALPETLIESELFGHDKGAFTGALKEKKGRVELAAGGTLFFDEIAEISLPVQAKLLRYLQEKTFERVGGTETLKSDARIIAATNKDLEAMVKAGTFREDLYYRLVIFPLRVPPLRERKSDIPQLIELFINKFSPKWKYKITAEAMNALMYYNWPGNVRELENTIERALILADQYEISLRDLPQAMIPTSVLGNKYEGDLQNRIDALEKEMIIEAIRDAGGNLSVAGKVLGLTERIIGLRVRKYDIDFRQFRKD